MRFVLHGLLLAIVFSPLVAVSQAGVRVRHIQVKGDQIALVRTAIGVATIIQVPDKPNSVVVGDQAGFKIEYLDQAVTIKPLHHGAKSNLYIYTDWQRFNAQLVAGSEAEADYVVYLDNPAAAPDVTRALEKKANDKKNRSPSTKWFAYQRGARSGDISFEVKRVGRSLDGFLFIEFAATSSRPLLLRPEWIWLTQAGVARPIQYLMLSTTELNKGVSAHGLIQILRTDIRESEAMAIEIRRKKTAVVRIPRVTAWK